MKDKTRILIIGVVIALMILFAFASQAEAKVFNKSLFDATWSFEYAHIYLGDKMIAHGFVQSWNDFEDSDCVQVKIDDKVYLTHYSNVVLISE